MGMRKGGNTEVATYSLNAANSALDDIENNLVATTPFTHLELSLGTDAFGLDTTGATTKTELLGVVRLHETKNTFLFNQTSITSFDNRATANTGFGVRYINDDEQS